MEEEHTRVSIPVLSTHITIRKQDILLLQTSYQLCGSSLAGKKLAKRKGSQIATSVIP